jgi:membrane associated rhomboid family serine protease
MHDPAALESILKLCAESAPVPWYPSSAGRPDGLSDGDLAECLELLHRSGLIAQTVSPRGFGNGYILTSEGDRALREPATLKRLGGRAPGRSAPPPHLNERQWEKSQAIRSRLMDPRRPVVSYTLIALNVLVHVIGTGYLGRSLFWRGLGDDPSPKMMEALHQVGSLRATDLVVVGPQWLRLLTCCFVHFGLIHIGVNMYSLYAVGPLMERLWGRWRYLTIYLLAGIGGSCTAMLFKPLTPDGHAINLAGASGALWGIMGSMAIWLFLNRKLLPPHIVSRWAWQIGIALGLNVLITFMIPGISAEAHYGGGLVGAVCALFAQQTAEDHRLRRVIGAIGLALVPVVCLGALYVGTQRSPVWARVRNEAIPHQEAEHKALQEKHDRAEMEEKLAEVRKLIHGHETAYEETLKSLLGKNASRRDPEAVTKAITELDRGKTDLGKAAEVLRAVGPYEDSYVESVRKTRLELIEARIKLFELSKESLEQGKDGKEHDETELKKQQSRVREIDARYQSLLK